MTFRFAPRIVQPSPLKQWSRQAIHLQPGQGFAPLTEAAMPSTLP
jgi:hypothetical protein